MTTLRRVRVTEVTARWAGSPGGIEGRYAAVATLDSAAAGSPAMRLATGVLEEFRHPAFTEEVAATARGVIDKVQRQRRRVRGARTHDAPVYDAGAHYRAETRRQMSPLVSGSVAAFNDAKRRFHGQPPMRR
jgi:hypothetical protein